MWAAVAAILVKVYMKSTIQVRSRVLAKEVPQKWNVASVTHKNKAHLASYGSLAHRAGLVNNRKLVAQRRPAMRDCIVASDFRYRRASIVFQEGVKAILERRVPDMDRGRMGGTTEIQGFQGWHTNDK